MTVSGPWTSGRDGADDITLLRAHADRSDPHAFALLVARHRDRCWSLALRMLADREDAADAVQDAFLSAHRSAGSFRGESAVSTWLHRIVVNACLNRLRRRGTLLTVPLDDQHDVPAETLVDEAQRLDVEAALASLPDDQRVVLVLCSIEDRPVREVAELLGVAEGTVKSRAARGRARLAALLGPGNPAGTVNVEAAVRPPGAPSRDQEGS